MNAKRTDRARRTRDADHVRSAYGADRGRRAPAAAKRTALLCAAMLLLAAACLAGCSGSESPLPPSNSFAGGVTDRADGPEGEPAADGAADGADARAKDIVSQMTLEQKAAQMFIVRPESLTDVGVATQAGDATREALRQYPVGGIVYFADNLLDADQTKTMLENTQSYGREASGLPLFLCVDEEGGTVSRVGGNPGFPIENVGDMADVGAAGDTQAAREVAKGIGTYLRDLGFNVDFAPDADIANNPNSDVMALRAFGSTADAVAPMVSAQVKGFADAGILCSAKHFPGIGGAEGDSHNVSIFSYKTADEMAAEELVPFEAAIEADVPFVMVGHLSAPQVTGNDLPASVSPAIVTDLLRGQLGYDGLIITDSLGMGAVNELYAPEEAAVLAIEAGVDIALMPADFKAAYQGVLDAVASGRLTEERLDSSVERIVRAKLAWEESAQAAA